MFNTVTVWNMKRSMNDAGGDYNAKRRSTGGMFNDMRILLPSQVLACCIRSILHLDLVASFSMRFTLSVMEKLLIM